MSLNKNHFQEEILQKKKPANMEIDGGNGNDEVNQIRECYVLVERMEEIEKIPLKGLEKKRKRCSECNRYGENKNNTKVKKFKNKFPRCKTCKRVFYR